MNRAEWRSWPTPRWCDLFSLGGWFLVMALALESLAGEFQPPDLQTRRAAIGDTRYLDGIEPRAFAESPLFQPKAIPKDSDWLASFDERGQTFDQFLKTRRNLFQAPRQVLYIQPVGEFPLKQARVLEQVAEFARLFFNAEIRVQPPVDPLKDAVVAIRSRHHPTAKDLQFLTTDLLDLLKGDLPADAYARIAVTMTDLYPDPSWNFVFGQASLVDRVGVYSFARYGDAEELVFLRRCLKVFTHETGHMFAMPHCIFFQCLMNGSNHLAESDATPLPLCPVCLRKLHTTGKIDIVDRYRKLGRFFEANGLVEEASWIERRVAELER